MAIKRELHDSAHLPAHRTPLLSDGVLRVEQAGHVLLMTLNRPEARNAINAELASALGEAVELLNRDPELRVAVLKGEGKAFCAGQDLKAFDAGEPIIPADHPEWGFAGFVRHASAKPIIAAIHGFALGGGLEIALACDLIVASDDSFFALPEVTRGLFAAGGGVPRLAQQIPPRIAARMVLTGEPLTAAEAERWGLVNEVVPVDALLKVALGLADRIAANAPLAVQASKTLSRRWALGSTWTDEPWGEINADLGRIFSSGDAQEGARAFLEKRSPQWNGR